MKNRFESSLNHALLPLSATFAFWKRYHKTEAIIRKRKHKPPTIPMMVFLELELSEILQFKSNADVVKLVAKKQWGNSHKSENKKIHLEKSKVGEYK